MNRATLLEGRSAKRIGDLPRVAGYCVAVMILLVAFAEVALHVWPDLLPVSFGFDGWRSVTGQTAAAWHLMAAVLAAVVFLSITVAWPHIRQFPLPTKRNSLARHRFTSWFAALALWLFTATLFFSFRTSIVMGDGYRFADALIEPSEYQSRWYLTHWMIRAIGPGLMRAFALSTVDTVRLCSALAGATTVVIFIRIARCLFPEHGQRWLLLGLLPSAYGLIQLWFGYVEVYPIITASWALLIWTYLLVLDQKLPLSMASFVAGLVYLFYIGNVMLLPSYGVLVAITLGRLVGWQDRIRQLALNLVVLVCTIVFFLSWQYGVDIARFWTDQVANANIGHGLSSNSIFYPTDLLLNPQHLLEFTNEWILVDLTGALLTLLSPLLWILFRHHWSWAQTARAALLGAIAIPFLAYAFLMQPLLGYPLDWDLFSYIGLFTFWFGGYVFLVSWRNLPMARWAYGALTMSGVVHLGIMLIPFITFTDNSALIGTTLRMNWNGLSRNTFLAPLLYQDSAMAEFVETFQFKSFESRDTLVLPSNASGQDAVYLFPLQQENKLQALAVRLGTLGARDRWPWRNLAWLYRVPGSNLPDPQNPLEVLAHTGDLTPQHIQDAVWTDGIELLGYTIDSENSDGRHPAVTLFLHSLKPIPTDYTFSVKARDAQNRVWAQDDKMPGDNSYPTTQWGTGDLVIEKYYPGLSVCAPAGEYRLSVQVYNAGTMQVLPLLDHEGSMVELGTVNAGEPPSARLEDMQSLIEKAILSPSGLVGYALGANIARAGDPVYLYLFWRGLGDTPAPHRTTVTLLDALHREYALGEQEVRSPAVGRGSCTFFDLVLPQEAAPGQASLLIDGAATADITIAK